MQRVVEVSGEGYLSTDTLEDASRVLPPSALVDRIELIRKGGIFTLRIEASWD